MKAIISRRPSPALVISILALVVAMAGTSYAALKLPKNSVGTKQLKKNAVATAKIKKNAVTTAKIKKKAITGAKVNFAKLGTVPSATTATTASTATVANSLSPLEAPHFVGDSGQPGFENGASNFPGAEGINFGRASFYKDHEGIVHLEGVVATGSGSVIFTLPSGFRPPSGTVRLFNIGEESYPVYIFGSNSNVAGTDVSGKVLALDPEAAVLDGITFRAES